jgi:hypothetical protein
MKPASLAQIKKELQQYSPEALKEMLLRLAKYKTENKELISYLLFDSDDLAGYIADLKYEISGILEEAVQKPGYQMRKGLRKAQRVISRYAKYTGFKETEAELSVFFCQWLFDRNIHRLGIRPVQAVFYKQVDKSEKLLASVHEDLRSDYMEAIRLFRK